MKRQTIFSIIERYRRFLYFCHRIPSKGLLSKGEPCKIEDPTEEVTQGDIVHPCVRYVEEGYEGHQWWMVYTPYYGGDESMENPRLCYADTENGAAPKTWKYYCTIRNSPCYGYNSDPTLLFYDGCLYVFWRECATAATEKIGCRFATFGCSVKNGDVTVLPEALLLNTIGKDSKNMDREVCPTFVVVDNQLKAYALDQKFDPNFISRIPSKIGSFIYRHNLFYLADALGIYNRIQNNGVSLWKGNTLNSQFQYLRTVKIEGVCRLYQPWHMDLFKASENDGTIYAVLQSSLHFADICLACSKDGQHFYMFRKPLLTSRSIGMHGLYKPTALIVGENLFLFYTARDNQDCKLNRMFVSSINWNTLLNTLH